MKTLDLVIVGAGPAGLAAAIYAKNDNLKFKIFEREYPGWFAKISIDSHYYVDNYPGRFNKVTGSDLIASFRAHLCFLGVNVEKAEITNIKKMKDGLFKLKINRNSSTQQIFTKTIIISTGTMPKELGLPNENKFLNHGLSYYCVKDGHKYVNKNVLVVGGRNSGTVAAIFLKKLGCNVTLIEKDNKINSKEKYRIKLDKLKVPYMLNTQITKLIGNKKLTSVEIETPTGKQKLSTNAIFSCIGLIPNNYLAKKAGLALDENGYIKINHHCETSIKGIYSAGDITGNLKQVVVACGQGAVAEYWVNNYLKLKSDYN